MQRWITIHTKPQAEGRAYIGIAASGWTVFCPFEMVRYIDRGVTCRKPLPIFGPYMFVLMEPERMTQLDGIEGIDGVLRDNQGKPGFADAAKIEELRREQAMGAFDRSKAGNWAQAGDDVQIVDSPLKGFVAKLKNAPRHKRVEMMLENCAFRITAPIDKLQKLRA